MMFINDRNYPGGPPGFLLGEYSLPINTLSNTSYVIDNCLTDLMVVSSVYVLFTNSMSEFSAVVASCAGHLGIQLLHPRYPSIGHRSING